MMRGVLFYAFAAAVLGGLESPLGAVVGGALLGVDPQPVGTYVDSRQRHALPVALAVILGVLLVRPTGLFGRARRGRYEARLGIALWVLAVAAVPRALRSCSRSFVSDFRRSTSPTPASSSSRSSGSTSLTGYTGQISLGHGALMASAATRPRAGRARALARLWTIPLAAVLAGDVGFAFGIPALRLSGLYLALATFGFAVSIPVAAREVLGPHRRRHWAALPRVRAAPSRPRRQGDGFRPHDDPEPVPLLPDMVDRDRRVRDRLADRPWAAGGSSGRCVKARSPRPRRGGPRRHKTLAFALGGVSRASRARSRHPGRDRGTRSASRS